MGSKSLQDSDSPLASSSSLIPQRLRSRRGSLASLSSTTQHDKEALSQALDQIHITASQTETLTTFNEYTSPPSSSSGPDSKGIASEIQGGLSGLYSRLKASVGNTRELVNPGGENFVAESASLNSPKAGIKSPVPSSKNASEPSRVFSSSAAPSQGNPKQQSGGQAPLVASEINASKLDTAQDKSSTALPGSTGSKSNTASLVGLRSPSATLTQARQPTTASLALPEVNISAAQREEPSSNPFDPKKVSLVVPIKSGPDADLQKSQIEPPAERGIDAVGAPSYHESQSGKLPQHAPKPSEGAPSIESASIQQDRPGRLPGAGQVRRTKSGQSESASGQPFPGLDGDRNDEAAYAVSDFSSEGEGNGTVPSKIATSHSNTQDDVFTGPSTTDRNCSNQNFVPKGRYQHLELPLRKSLAPPLITRSISQNPSLKRVSSSGTNSDSLASSAILTVPNSESKEPRKAATGRTSTSRPADPASIHRDLRTMNVFSQVKNKVLNKEYWMKDQNAKDCFYCGDPFSTFRRKHHCRTCGQIFDSKCMSQVPGQHFGQAGTLRVCKPCEGIILDDDDSSDFSDDGTLSVRGMRPRHGSTGAAEVLGTPSNGSSPPNTKSLYGSPKHPDLAIPTMSIPATRKAGRESGRNPTVLEIDAQRTLARPSSSKSLKSSFTNKSYHAGHRRHNSRNLLQRGFKAVDEDNAPFHQDPGDDKTRPRRLPAFHDDNIIDPDLAPYLSDEASSGEEQMSIAAALNGDGLSRSYENDRHGFSRLAATKGPRSRAGDKSIGGVTFASRDADSHSLNSSSATNAPRSSKRRNLSITSNAHLRPSPRGYRASLATPSLGLDLQEDTNESTLSQAMSLATPAGGARMIRSSSMRGAAAPAIELNNASLLHVRKLLHQLLQNSHVPNVGSWERALMPILLRATDDVNPEVQNGDDIDIRHYVKLKKIPGGRPGDTSYVSGLVFTKNLALKSMPRSISHPNILILTFALEYARHQQHFMSIDPIIRQEREYLQNVVNRIAALRPQLLLVERNVSGLALEFLEQANIATAYNVKASVLEAVSRCCQTRIVSSMDKLAIKPAQAGKCASFYLKTYVNEGRKKTYMFLSGCAKELGCTIVLRGAVDSTLAKMKRITEFMIYVVYNLKLETCLMRDEFAAIPLILEIGSMSPGRDILPKAFQAILSVKSKEAERHQSISKINSEADGLKTHADISSTNATQSKASGALEAAKPNLSLPDEDSVPEDVPMPTFYGDMVEEHKTKILSASPFVKFTQPYLLVRAREQERRLAYLKRLRDQDVVEERHLDEKIKPEKFDLITPEMVHGKVHTASRKVREVLHAVHDAEYDKALHNYQTQSKQWETYISGNTSMFDPYAHQNIAVLYSLVCTVTTVPCSGPDMLALSFYNEHDIDDDFEADCTLGQYVEDLCVGANAVCTVNGCERKMLDHHRQYVHGEAQLSVFVERYPCKLRGLQGTILMWSLCRICGKETQTLPMSESTWKYSFGKYLELSFWCSDLHARADVCPHDLHRNHLRYFGFKDMAIRVHYDPIALLEIIVPRARITWKVDNDLRFKNELFTKIEKRLSDFMVSVKTRIKSINIESVIPEKTESCIKEVERLSKSASDEHHALVQKLCEKYMDSKHYEIIPLNRAVRAVQEKVAEWDKAFADFDRDFFPSEGDIRRLATLQLKKFFLDRDESATSLTSTDDGSTTTIPEEAMTETMALDSIPALTPQTRRMSPEKAHDMLAAVVEKHVSTNGQPDQHQSAPPSAVPALGSEQIPASLQDVDRKEVRHLDLAVSSEKYQNNQRSAVIDEQSAKAVVEADENPKVPASQIGFNSDTNKDDLRPEFGSKETRDLWSETLSSTENSQVSEIPRSSNSHHRTTRSNVSPTISRTQSQPAHLRNNLSSSGSHSVSSTPQSPSLKSQSPKLSATPVLPTSATKPVDRKLSDRLGLSALKQTSLTAGSMIPRSIANRGKESKVSNLAKHFDQLSREFEKERIRERRERAARSRQARAYPMAASKPIVQVYRNVDEAVGERDPSDEDLLSSGPPNVEQEGTTGTINHMAKSTDSQTPGEGFHAEETTADNTETDDRTLDSHVGSDAEGEEIRSEGEHSLLDDVHISATSDEHQALTTDEAQLDVKLDLPKHERMSLMKVLTKFWAERSASGWQSLEYPLNATDHIFADSDIIVREDEPSSLIAFALGSEDYQAKQQNIWTQVEEFSTPDESGPPQSSHSNPKRAELEQSLLKPTGTHLKYQFVEGSAKMTCKVFYAEQFDAVRRKCGVSERIVESLSRCMKWDSKGGKTKSVFLKTLDDRFVLKSLSPIETRAFLTFAPAYFRMLSESLFHELPSVIAKMLGFYQIVIKNPVTNVDFDWYLIVMENLFYDRSNLTRIFDLKGSMRNRRIQSTGEQNEVLLDENMVEFIYESPLFSREHSKKLLRASVWNDTLFLAGQNVMDYSLMIAIDETRKELVVGIIDCIRTYTWDKRLETWIKDRGKNKPTVTSPKEYKNRFREAMGRYVLQAPNCWHQFKMQAGERGLLRGEEMGEDTAVHAAGL